MRSRGGVGVVRLHKLYSVAPCYCYEVCFVFPHNLTNTYCILFAKQQTCTDSMYNKICKCIGQQQQQPHANKDLGSRI